MKVVRREAEDNLYDINVALINEALNQDKQEILEDVAEQMVDEMKEYLEDPNDVIIRDADLGQDWGYYEGDFDDYLFVKNIKGRGFPDFEEVLKKIVEKLKKNNPDITLEDVQEILTDSVLDSYFWETVQMYVNELEEEYDNFIVTGRSGGYWGLELSIWNVIRTNMKLLDELYEDFKSKFWDLQKKGEIVDFMFDVVDDNYLNEGEITESDAYDIIRDNFFEYIINLYESKYEELYLATQDLITKLNNLNIEIEDIITTMENPDYWVEDLMDSFSELERL